jgi:hypothetical protein
VTGTVNGVAQPTATMNVTIEPRDWSQMTVQVSSTSVRNGSDPAISLQTEPRRPQDLGSTWFSPRTWTLAEATDDNFDGGPNHGIAYVSSWPIRSLVGEIVLNTDAMALGSAFSQLQDTRRRAPGSSSVLCSSGAIPGLQAKVDAHEHTHVQVVQSYVAQHTSGFASQIEALTGDRAGALEVRWRAIAEALSNAASDESKRIVDDPDGPYLTKPAEANGRPCNLSFFPSGS